MPIRLIAIDVDGTLLDSHGRIPAANLEALEDAVARGLQIVIVTGRSFSFALPAVEPLPDPLTLIVYNGAIARTRGGDTLIRRLLPREIARDVLRCTLQWRDCALMLFDRPHSGQLVYDQLDWAHPNRVRFRERNRHIIEAVAALEDALVEDPIQLAFNGPVAPMRDLVAMLGDHPAAAGISVSRTEYVHRDFSLVDVCAGDTTKGSTLARLAAQLGIDASDVLAVGDNFNDLDMLTWAGVGVVMGNAADDVKLAGLEVTATNDEAGLALAIRRFT